MLSILQERIHDNRFLRLLENLLKAGYLEEWRYHNTLSGCPQGGVISPILSNIYLDRLDQYIEHMLIPAYTRGTRRRRHTPYERATYRLWKARRQGQYAQVRQLRQEQHQLPSRDPKDPTYRRLHYVRYADDWLLGFTGPRSEAEDIKRSIGAFLRDALKLELSEQKTLITHARTESARFLGYEVCIFHANSKVTAGQRSINGDVGLRVPHAVIKEKCGRYMKGGKPIHRMERTDNSVFSIVRDFDAEYTGVVNYYRAAYNLTALGELRYVTETSLVKTVARKLRLSAPRVWRKLRRTYEGRKVLMVTQERAGKKPLVAMFGRTDLQWRPGARFLNDQPAPIWSGRTELVQRLLAEACELCGSKEAVEVHHIRALKDLKRPGRPARPRWAAVMAARRRKTLVVCHTCHVDITHGRPRRNTNRPRVTGEPDARKPASPVRRGADGNVPLPA